MTIWETKKSIFMLKQDQTDMVSLKRYVRETDKVR